MHFKPVLLIALVSYMSCEAYTYKDSVQQRFSIGASYMFVRLHMPDVLGNNEIIADKWHRGVSLDLRFMWNDMGFTTGLQLIGKDYYEEYPDNGYSRRLLGWKHSGTIRAIPALFNYRVFNSRYAEVVVNQGYVWSHVSDYAIPQTNYSPAYIKSKGSVTDYITWSAGIGLRWNLYKKCLFLNGQLQTTGKPRYSSNVPFTACSLGLHLNMLRIYQLAGL